ncbi:MAG TPA: carboxypeptidase-like regulatory domain-containing protein [Longimicrobium sp.]|nr:carboxypeptidase-like regulatory domain-containing protein [Longimicrobium sp.]
MNPDLSKLPLCDQEWDAMEPLGDGRRLCARCRHPVTDFRGMTKHEITLEHVMSGERMCGVYSPEQLAPVTAAEPRRFRSGLVTLTLGASLLAARAEAQATRPAPHEQAQLPADGQSPPRTQDQASAPSPAADAQDVLVIRGTVRDNRTGEPLRDAMVRLAERNVGAITDSAGGYTLRVPDPGRGELHLRFGRIGFTSMARTVSASRRNRTVDVRLEKSALLGLVGYVVVPAAGQARREELRRVGYSVTRIEGSR